MATKKKVISGSIAPRWPKPRVVRWLELGALPALGGLWLPDWVGGYARQFAPGSETPASWLAPLVRGELAFPPVLTYVGAVVLLVGCAQGIRDMGRHYMALKVLGGLAVAFAGASVALHFLLGSRPDATFALLIASIGLAAFFGSGFLWVTIAKVAEITAETRTAITQRVVLAGAVLGLAASLAAAAQVVAGSLAWGLTLRAAVLLFSLTFLACRYGVHCYKTQSSIGATFTQVPEEQFWI